MRAPHRLCRWDTAFDSGATLILGNGQLLKRENGKSYTDGSGTEQKLYDYKTIDAGGELIIDGGAVWTKGDEFNPTSVTNSAGKVFYDMSGDTEKQYYYSNSKTSKGSLINNNGTLDMWGGLILQNNDMEGNFGSAVYSGSNTNVNMYSAIVRQCAIFHTKDDRGRGAVYVGNSSVTWTTAPAATVATFNMYGGEIVNNATASDGYQDGGGVALDQAQMNLYGGSISYNHAGIESDTAGAGDGGGIMVRCGSVLDMYGGTVSKNYAAGYGGGIVAWNGTVNVHGGTISQNVGGFGGGIGISASYDKDGSVATSSVVMTGGSVEYNDAIATSDGLGGYGGGICAGSGNFKKGASLRLSGGSIHWAYYQVMEASVGHEFHVENSDEVWERLKD